MGTFYLFYCQDCGQSGEPESMEHFLKRIHGYNLSFSEDTLKENSEG